MEGLPDELVGQSRTMQLLTEQDIMLGKSKVMLKVLNIKQSLNCVLCLRYSCHKWCFTSWRITYNPQMSRSKSATAWERLKQNPRWNLWGCEGEFCMPWMGCPLLDPHFLGAKSASHICGKDIVREADSQYTHLVCLCLRYLHHHISWQCYLSHWACLQYQQTPVLPFDFKPQPSYSASLWLLWHSPDWTISLELLDLSPSYALLWA